MKKKTIIIIILILLIICFIFSLINIINWFIDSKKTNEQMDDILDKVDINKSNGEEVIIPQENIDKADPYWDFIKMDLIDVDFTNLLKTNNETKGWLKVNGTNINYPFVQATNNKYYLTHSFDKSYNNAGWVFLDYRNNIATLDKNTIIYAHGRTDTTMFGSLKYILDNEWAKNTNNHVIKISTINENSLWQIFSVYKIPTTSDYLQVEFNTIEEFIGFSKLLINRSEFDFKTSINQNDYILTLSTCLNDEIKVVLHAKLIKKEIK